MKLTEFGSFIIAKPIKCEGDKVIVSWGELLNVSPNGKTDLGAAVTQACHRDCTKGCMPEKVHGELQILINKKQLKAF